MHLGDRAGGEVLKLLGIWRGASFACESSKGFGKPGKERPVVTRLPASQRTREELSALIEGRLRTTSAKDELVKLATRLIVEEALEGEAGDAVGRDYYEHGAQPGQGYRNGYRMGRLKAVEGAMEYSAPAWGATVGGLPGVRPAGLERVRDHVSVCRRHRRAVAAWRQTRAGSGRLGLYHRRSPRAAAHDGRLQGRCRNCDRILRGHEEARPE